MILSTGVAVALVAVLVGAVITNHVVTVEESNIISAVLGAAIGAVATYLGGGGPANE